MSRKRNVSTTAGKFSAREFSANQTDARSKRGPEFLELNQTS